MSESALPEEVVVNASVLVDLFAGTDRASSARARMASTLMHAPAHLDAEVFSALGRLHRAEHVSTATVDTGVSRLSTIPLTRHPLPELLAGAWARRDDYRLVDALYVELAARLNVKLLTTDYRLARACPHAEPV